MHRSRLNHARLQIVIRPRGPLLIKSGLETPDPTRPQMEFVRTRHAEKGETVYLPGTSLKGAIRAHAERALQGAGAAVCNPLGQKQGKACHSKRWGVGTEPAQKFHHQCPACRTFGSLTVQGRVHIGDAYPWATGCADSATSLEAANRTETRWQVAIDRKTGQAHGGALFDLEVAVGGEFHTEILLTNFQLWQLGLILAVLREMDEGLVPLGFGKSRGLGQVGVELSRLQVETAGRGVDAFVGTAELASEEARLAYGLHDRDRLELEAIGLGPADLVSTWRGHRFELEGGALAHLVDQLLEGPLASYVDSRQGQRVAERER